MSTTCTTCQHPERAAIDAALRAGTSERQIGKTYGLGRTTIANHRGRCVVGLGRDAKPKSRGGRPPKPPAVVSEELRRIESAEDVIEDLQRLRVEAFDLFSAAKSRADWKQAQLLFNSLMQLVDRFGEMHKVLGSKSSFAVNFIDAREQTVLNTLAGMTVEQLRALREIPAEQRSAVLETIDGNAT
jgi:hypothetical protein